MKNLKTVPYSFEECWMTGKGLTSLWAHAVGASVYNLEWGIYICLKVIKHTPSP